MGTTYHCAVCGAVVKLADGRFERDCVHLTAPIVANAAAIVHAHGGVLEPEDEET